MNENPNGGRFSITGHLCCEMVESPAKGFRGFIFLFIFGGGGGGGGGGAVYASLYLID